MQQPQQRKYRIAASGGPQCFSLESPSAWSHELSTALLGSSVVVLSCPSTIPEQGPWSAATISDSKQGDREQHTQHHGNVEPGSFEAAVQHFALQSILDVNWQSPVTPLCILLVQHSKLRCETGRDFKKLLCQSLREDFKSNRILFFQPL